MMPGAVLHQKDSGREGLCFIIIFSRLGHQPCMVASPPCGHLNRENSFALSSLAPDNLASRAMFGRPVLRQPAHSPHPG